MGRRHATSLYSEHCDHHHESTYKNDHLLPGRLERQKRNHQIKVTYPEGPHPIPQQFFGSQASATTTATTLPQLLGSNHEIKPTQKACTDSTLHALNRAHR
eukprot:scaffold48096_cov33-Tisochrysis_lutea.AAC.5